MFANDKSEHFYTAKTTAFFPTVGCAARTLPSPCRRHRAASRIELSRRLPILARLVLRNDTPTHGISTLRHIPVKGGIRPVTHSSRLGDQLR
jgi:hypothetical protein